ncbi:MAG: T9SS type A sorting domain-containing protein [Bacteroidota bacterium]
MFIFLYTNNALSQSIWTNPITGTNPNTANPYTTGQTVNPNITVSGIGRGTGITGTSANDRYNASGWSTSGIDLNDCFTFTLTPCATGPIDFISFVYTGQASGSGPTSFAFRSSIDGFVSNIGTPNAGGTTISLAAPAYQNITSAIIFKFYAWGGSGGTYSINDFTFNGSASCTPACTAPATTITPITQTVCANSITTISVSSSATIPSYTWQASANGSTGWNAVTTNIPVGANYSGSNTAMLTVTASSTYYYQCLVAENGTCTATSGTSTLVVNTSPTITTQPINKTICSGSNVTFSVVASGSPLTYQWQENTGSGFVNITNGGVYSGATAATLTLTAPSLAMTSYSYQCIVSVTSCSSVTTSEALLTINAAPSAPSAPTPAANPGCGSTTLAAMVPPATVNYYWEGTSSTASLTTQPTSSTYNVSSSGTYYVRAVDATGTCWSSSTGVLVTINTPVTITSGANDKGVCSGNNTTMDITGAAAPKQWWVSTDNGVTFNMVTTTAVYTGGINTNILSITNPPVSYNGYQYLCVVSVSGCPTLTSSIGVLTVTQTPSAPPTPTALANPACISTTLSAMSSTVAGVTWYWQGTSSAGTSTTNPTSSPYNVTSTGTYYVRARTDGSSCLSSSASTLITINSPPSITSNPTDKTQCVGTNTTYAVSATGATSYQWQVNTGSGFTNLTNTAPYSNVTSATMLITNISAGMNGYLYQCIVSGASPCAAVTSSAAALYITASGAPSVAATLPLTTAVACNAFNLSWTNGNGSNRLVVMSLSPIVGTPSDGTNYLSSSSFGTGGTIATGEYVVYKGTSNTVYVTGLAAASTYYYNIFEYNGCSLNYLTSGTVPNGDETTISCINPPGVTGVYIDACPGAGCNYEGNNELIWGTSGSYGFNVATNGPSVSYNSSSPPSPVFISAYGLNSAVIASLNTAVGSCTSTVFVDPNTLGYIPANAKFLIANSCMCIPSPYDLSGLCNSGPIYVVFGTGPNWSCNTTGGVFGNSGSGVKYFDLDLSSWGVPLDPIYNFNSGSLVTGNGAAITTNPAGGAATGYFNTSCVVPTGILPIELMDFYATKNGTKNDLIWKVASEKNVLKYIIEKSEDGINFKELTVVDLNSSVDGLKSYITEDLSPYNGISYYRLSTLEKNYKTNHYKIIDLDRSNDNWKPLYYQQENNLILEFKNSIPKNSVISLFNLSGQLLTEMIVKDSQTKIDIQGFAAGIYFIRISTPFKTENIKLIIQK